MFIGQPIEAAKAYQNYTDWMAGKERWSFLETTFKGNIQHSAVDKQITYISRPHDTYNSGNLINGKLGVESTDDKEWVGFENKNMETDARVKNYGMEILSEGAIASGRWTGGVKTSVRNAFLTFPVQAAYKVHPRTNLKLGVFLSYLIEGKFDGVVYDGYLRNGDPTGEKAVFTGDATATYDFSDELRKFQWGLQAGVDWEAFKHLKLYADLSWGLNSAFPESFKTITFSMYPIYFNVGVGYLF